MSEWVDLKGETPESIRALLTSRGLEVESLRRLDQGFEGVVSAKLLERAKHPDADRLSVCQVSTGKGEPLTIVCGAQNMKAGDVVALAQVGALLPNGLKIEKSKIRGVASSGMLCSEEELKLKDSSEGILILPPETPAGLPLAQVLRRDDTVFELSLTPNRGDCLSHLGVAREVSAGLRRKLKMPKIPLVKPGKCAVKTVCEAGDGGLQFFGVTMDGVRIGPSPDWVIQRLESLGQRSINNVVDATNLVMLELGHPMHAYDMDRLHGNRMSIRMSRAGESLPLLDGSSVELTGAELVIADGAKAERPVALAGVMGGGNSEVTDATTRLFLECAEFSPTLVRRAARKFDKHTDAAHRFERGMDPAGLVTAISRLAQGIQLVAGGKVTGATVSQHASRKGFKRKPIAFLPKFMDQFLGIDVPAQRVKSVLSELGCNVKAGTGAMAPWQVTPPTWRLDLNIREDLAEEVARTVGYDKIPSTLPPLSSAPRGVISDATVTGAFGFAAAERARESFRDLGFSEAIHYAFNNRKFIESFGLSSEIAILNPLSELTEVLVPSLLPGLVQAAQYNWNRHFGSDPLAIRIFELRPTFHKGDPSDGDPHKATGVLEKWRLSFAMAGPRVADGLKVDWADVEFSDVKAVVSGLMDRLGVTGLRFAAPKGELPVYHPGQSAEVVLGGRTLGVFGKVHPAKAREWKLRGDLWIGELDWDALRDQLRARGLIRRFKAWSEFPVMERDFALVVRPSVSAEDLLRVATKAGKPLVKSARVFDVYRGEQVQDGLTSVAVRLIFSADGRSLEEREADQASAQILEAWKRELGVELRS